MEYIQYIAEAPLAQIFFIIILWALAEYMGMPIGKIVRKIFRINGTANSELADKMDNLKDHYNDTTTDLLKEIKENISEMKFTLKDVKNKLDEFERYGIKNLKE